jgi:hypothetical protein
VERRPARRVGQHGRAGGGRHRRGDARPARDDLRARRGRPPERGLPRPAASSRCSASCRSPTWRR